MMNVFARGNRPHETGRSAATGHAGAFTPNAVLVSSRHVEVGGDYVASFAVTGYPREVYGGWLQPLLSYPGRLDLSLHIEPIDPATAAARLKRQLGRLESGRRHTEEKGRLLDPYVEAATEDAYELSARVARGEGRLFRLGLYLTVHATSQQALAEDVTAVRTLAASLLIDAQPTTYRSLQGWITSLPLGLDLLGQRRTFDTAALATAFPFTSPDLPSPDPTSVAAPNGVLYGYNIASQGLVFWDRFDGTLDNHNAVILGRSGAGKSYLVKLEALRSLYRGIEIAVIDPEDEYRRLCHAVGGTYLHLGAEGVRINPFDLPIAVRDDGRRTAPKDALIRRSLFIHTMLAVLLGTELTAQQRTVLDRAVTITYQQAGITNDPRTWNRAAPLLADLATVLSGSDGPVAAELAERLRPFTEGAFSQLFSGPTTTRPDGHLTVFSLRDLPDELKAIGTLLTLDIVWRRVSNPTIRRPRSVIVDEAWLLMRDPAGAQFLYRMAKSARKYWLGLTLSTQDIGDVLGSELGKAIVANAATQILLHQAPQAIDEIAIAFHLSDGERQFLLAADRGQGLLCAGTQRVGFQAISSSREDQWCTSDPAQLAAQDDADDGTVEAIDLDSYQDLDLAAGTGDEFVELDAA
jgi:type IV secretory pathway VirB4 component